MSHESCEDNRPVANRICSDEDMEMKQLDKEYDPDAGLTKEEVRQTHDSFSGYTGLT